MSEPATFWSTWSRKLSAFGGAVGGKASEAATAVKSRSVVLGRQASEVASQAASVAADNIKQGFTVVGNGVSHVADDISKATLAVPELVRCDKCNATVVVPSTTFHWVCMQGHVSGMSDLKCSEGCGALKPTEAKPTIICNSCQTSIVVPTSKIANGLRTTGLVTSRFLDSTTAGARKQIQVMSNRPATFSCSFCLSPVPTPNWTCASCETSNAPAALTCATCNGPQSQKKAPQKFNAEGWPVEPDDDREWVECPSCKRRTVVPTSALVASLAATGSEVGVGLKKMYYSLVDEPYVICGTCSSLTAVKEIPKVRPGAGSQEQKVEEKSGGAVEGSKPPEPLPNSQPGEPNALASSSASSVSSSSCSSCSSSTSSSAFSSAELKDGKIIGHCPVCKTLLGRDLIRTARTLSSPPPSPAPRPPPPPPVEQKGPNT